MNLVKRLRNLWALSELEVTKENGKLHIDYKGDQTVSVLTTTPRMAQIIKMHDPVADVLKEETND